MTAIVGWLNKESNPHAIWVATDSLVTKHEKPKEANIYDALITNAQKILTIPVVSRSLDSNWAFTKKYLAYEIGYAYAGNVLLGLAVADKLRAIFSNLATLGAVLFPCFDDMAKVVSHIMQKMILDMGINTRDIIQLEILIFGYCHKCEKLEIFKFILDYKKSPFEINYEKVDLTPDESIVQLGVNQGEIAKKIIERRKNIGQKNGHWWQAPRFSLQEIINDQAFPMVAGEILIVNIYPDDFIYRANSKRPKFVNGKPVVDLSFAGFNVADISEMLGDPFLIPGVISPVE